MAGFDMQFTAEGSADRFAADLRAFAQAVRDPAVRQAASGPTDRALAAFARLNAYVEALRRHSIEMRRAGLAGAARQQAMAVWDESEGAALRPRRTDRESLEEAIEMLLDLIAQHRAAFEQAHGARATGFMECAAANLRGYGVNLHGQHGADRSTDSAAASLERENRRDAVNAGNLRWLIEKGYPGRKIIVWAHNAHVMNAYYGSDWSSVHLEPRADAMKPSGAYLKEWLGDAVYTIGTTAYEGEDGWATGGAATPIAPAPDGSLEARLHSLGHSHAFLDFRALDQDPEHPLRAPQTMRVPKYEAELLADVTRPYDGIFYIDRMERARPLT
jgi:erythromycin esterase-like protein